MLIFFIGLICGSFINVLIHRLPRGESIVSPPSRCPACGHRLTVLELVPVLSFLLLRGRCRSCRVRIPWRYPVVELVTGLLFLWVWQRTGGGWEGIAGLGLVFFLLPAAGIDLEHGIIPDALTLTGLAVGLALSPLRPGFSPLHAVLGVLAGGGALYGVALVSRGGLGGGDIKLLAMIGAFGGWPVALGSIFAGSLLGLLASLPGLWRRELGLKSRLPFGPFLAAGALCIWMYGERFLRLYLDFVM